MSRRSYTDDDNINSTTFILNPIPSSNKKKEKDCKACHDFKDWLKSRSTTTPTTPTASTLNVNTTLNDDKRNNCPLYRDELGRSTWGFLHTMAAYYPEKPTNKEENQMINFIDGLATFFPCDECATDFQQEIIKNPPRTKNRFELSQWFCEQHNTVNRKLSKPEFDCSKIFERWKDGWKDGSCD